MRNALMVCSILLASLFGEVNSAHASKEYLIKTAFIYNFLKLVEWPEEASTDNYDVCLVHPHEFGTKILALTKKDIRGNAILVHEHLPKARVEDCQILYVSDEVFKNHPDITHQYAPLPILTIGESDNFIKEGGIIRFDLDKKRGKKVGFSVNLIAANRSGLKINSDLIRIAKEVIK